MKVSLVTISYNQARFLEAAIQSVLRQGYDNLEYIIVDPGSTDGSRDILWRYRAAVAQLVLEPDAGPADGLNRGFALASGQLYGFLNADDVLLPGAIAAAVEAIKAQPRADLVYGHGYLIDETGRRIRRFYSDRFHRWGFLRDGVVLLQQSTFFRATAFQAVGGFNPANRTCWDGELWLDLALAGKRFVRVNQFWSGFRVYEASITGAIAAAGGVRQAYEADLRRLFEKATGHPPGRWHEVERAMARLVKWGVSPVALAWRLGSLLDHRVRQSPV